MLFRKIAYVALILLIAAGIGTPVSRLSGNPWNAIRAGRW